MSRDFIASAAGREFKKSPNRDRIVRSSSIYAIRQIAGIKFGFMSGHFFNQTYPVSGSPRFYATGTFTYTDTSLQPDFPAVTFQQVIQLGQQPVIDGSGSGPYSIFENIPRFTPRRVGRPPNFPEYVNVISRTIDSIDVKVAPNPNPATQFRLTAQYSNPFQIADLASALRTKLDTLPFPGTDMAQHYRADGSPYLGPQPIKKFNLSSGIESPVLFVLSRDGLFPLNSGNLIQLPYVGVVLRDVKTAVGTARLWRFITGGGVFGLTDEVRTGFNFDDPNNQEISCREGNINQTLSAPSFDDLLLAIPNIWNLEQPRYELAEYAFPPNVLMSQEVTGAGNWFTQLPSCL